MLSDINTLRSSLINTSRVIKISSKEKKSQCTPYFFTMNSIKNTSIKKNVNNKNKIIKKNH